MRKKSFFQPLLIRLSIVAAAFCAASSGAQPKPLQFALPDDQTELAKGPGFDTAIANCGACHSAEYIKSQPHGASFGKAFWQAEVAKMINVYKAPIAPEDAKIIVDYLTEAYK
ncbi:MAG: cytochrome c [Beijerinckiaceae bacterium]|nr:cytochrome c [Beijerinckiaceae bacterium]